MPLPVTLVRAQARVVLAQGQADVLALVGVVHIVQGVEGILQFVVTLAEAETGQVALAHPHIGLAPGLAHAEADLAVVGDLPAEVEAVAEALQAVLGYGVVALDGLDVLRFAEQVRGDEVARAGVQGLVELAVELLVVAQLQARQPFGTQFVDAVLAVAGAEVEGAVALHVVGEVQAQAQVVGAGALAAGVDHQGVAVLALDHPVMHLLEVVQAVEGAHVALQAFEVQRLAQGLADVAADHRVADLRVVLDQDAADDWRAFTGQARAVQGLVAVGGQRAQLGQAAFEDAGGAVAGLDHVAGTAEVGGAEARQRWLDQHVGGIQGGQLDLGVGAGHQGHRLVEHVHHRGQLLARAQRCADVHHYHAVDAHLAGHVHRDVVHHAAVHQQPAVHFHRGEHGGYRHAGADRLGQVAAAEHHLLAGGDIGGHGAEGDGQLVEVTGIAGMHQQTLQQQGEVLALDHPERQAQAAVIAEAQALLDQEVAVVLLAAEGHVLPWRVVGQGLLPVQVGGDLLQLIDLIARRIEPADHRAHAGAGDGVDLDALFLQRLEHADMGQPAGGAAGQHQADPGFGLGQAKEGEQQQAKQKAAHNASLVRRRAEAGYYRAPILVAEPCHVVNQARNRHHLLHPVPMAAARRLAGPGAAQYLQRRPWQGEPGTGHRWCVPHRLRRRADLGAQGRWRFP
ncbi:hypothetical protein D3C84_448220 [compost metagenome]